MSEDITPCPICLRLVTDLVLCEHGKEKDEATRVDRQPNSDVALPQRATETTPALERRIVDMRGDKRYCVVGPRMAVDFHFSDIGGAFGVTAGLECHYSECPTYLEGKEPFSEQCWLTGVRCWGDGTSR